MVSSTLTHSALLLRRGLLDQLAAGSMQRAAAPLVSSLACTSQRAGIWRFGSSALHSSAAATVEGGAKEGEQAAAGEQAAEEQPAAEQAAPMSAEECAAALAEAREALEGEKKRAEELKDKLLRTLADMENLRERTSRLTAETKQFAVQGLVKNLLDVADNLERAAGSVPEADLAENSECDRDRALQLLRSLRDGVLMTDTVLMKVLANEGVSRFDPLGEKFDPNLHNALFEVPDATKEPGTVAVVHKRGYLLNERVVRAAEGLEAERPAEQQNGALRIGPDQQQHQQQAPLAAQLGQDVRQQRLQLHYRTHWSQPLLHHSLAGGEWQSVPMQQVVSGGGWWTAANLHLNGSTLSSSSDSGAGNGNGSPLLEFVVTDGQDAWDKAPDDSNYRITTPGNWRLRDGHLAAVPTPPLCLVSDLDDTMIGDDEGTAAFRQWWHEEGVPAGGRLVYNTGRALDLFEQLLQDKGHVLPEPDMLISAIGTRIYTKRFGRWQEDEGYTAQLGRGWQLEGVREACYKSLATVGKEAMHFRPPNEMSEHKVTCGVRLDVMDQVLSTIRSELQQAGIRYRLVVSGSGDWRFVDLVPAEAGKLQALEYARRTMEFEPHQTVACGDSGNDIDMLEGGHLSIIVGNAHKELLEWAATQRAAHAGEVYVAQGHRAWGILEGLQRYGFKTY